ncbi:hypothetical protein RSAG8_11478, partial [Rhizoctonia solani AG-8 WAC10335]
MQSFRVPKPEPQEVDVIVAGGGPAGCVVAGRLAKADPNLQVMLIEYGPNNIDDPMVSTPAVYPRNMRLLESDKAHFYYDTNKSKHLRGRKTIVPCAKVLGGGSSINFQMYTRASASDWNDFKTEGWNYQDLLPLMKRLENYQKPCNNDTHGFDGPIAISNGGWVAPIAQDFLRAATAVGIPLTDDLQDCQQSHAAEIWAKWINKDTGRRSDAASAYVHPIMAEQNNLHLRCNSKVARVIFEGTKAVGVAYVNSRDHGQTKTVETIVKARKMVVLTAGTLSTPQYLPESTSQCFNISYPFSRGSIHISSSDPYADSIFDSGFLNHEADIAPIRWSYKKVREVARRMDAYRGELTALHPHFHPDSPAACEDVDLQTAKEYMPAGQLTVGIHMGSWSKPRKPLAPGERRIVEDVKYSKEDDEAIDNWVRDHVETTWHSLGTCAMKPRDQEGVLDPRLNVYGTTNLKVGDLSLCPDNLGTNTYSSALLCGEKCADLIAEELGLTITNPHIPVMRRASAKQH